MKPLRIAAVLLALSTLTWGCFPNVWEWEPDLDDRLGYADIDYELEVVCERPDPLEIELGYGEFFFTPMAEEHDFRVYYGLQGGSHVFGALRINNPELVHPTVEVIFELLDDDKCAPQEPETAPMDPPQAHNGYSVLLIRDISTEINGTGTPGADICGVAVDCGGEAVTSDARPYYAPGSGGICGQGTDQEPEGRCSSGIARDNPYAALDDGMVCEPADPDPNFDDSRSCYVSLGIDGELGVDFGRDLQGCTITIVEHVGRDAENYEVFICAANADGDPDTADCLNGDMAAASTDMGGSIVLEGPAAEVEDPPPADADEDEDEACPPVRIGYRRGLLNADQLMTTQGHMEVSGVLIFHEYEHYGGDGADRVQLTVRDQCGRVATAERRLKGP